MRPNSTAATKWIGRPLIAAVSLLIVSPAFAEPVTIRIGTGFASEEQLWLMAASPELTPHSGTDYIIELTQFGSAGQRVQALQAGQLDATSSSSTGAIFAASQGVPIRVVASMALESERTFSTAYYARSSDNISLTPEGLRGKIFGINGYRTSIELYARYAVGQAGLDPSRDVQWVVTGMPTMGEALAQGKIDIGVFPSTFAFPISSDPAYEMVFSSAGISGIEEGFDVIFHEDFVENHPDALRAFLQDFYTVTEYWEENPTAARQILIDAGISPLPPEIYLTMTADDDLLRIPDIVAPRKEMYAELQERLLEVNFLENAVDIDQLVDLRFLPEESLAQ